jgi:hypothetical protein
VRGLHITAAAHQSQSPSVLTLLCIIHLVIGQRQFIVFPRHGHVLHSAELTRLLTERRE